ncbi:hypothetical protein [Endozoicomonas atrinae]|uniref:hypothetical protein n=1 Tax=Endozoicomonas atrinae TaxID=1333660 RepID=UPI003B001FE0
MLQYSFLPNITARVTAPLNDIPFSQPANPGLWQRFQVVHTTLPNQITGVGTDLNQQPYSHFNSVLNQIAVLPISHLPANSIVPIFNINTVQQMAYQAQYIPDTRQIQAPCPLSRGEIQQASYRSDGNDVQRVLYSLNGQTVQQDFYPFNDQGVQQDFYPLNLQDHQQASCSFNGQDVPPIHYPAAPSHIPLTTARTEPHSVPVNHHAPAGIFNGGASDSLIYHAHPHPGILSHWPEAQPLFNVQHYPPEQKIIEPTSCASGKPEDTSHEAQHFESQQELPPVVDQLPHHDVQQYPGTSRTTDSRPKISSDTIEPVCNEQGDDYLRHENLSNVHFYQHTEDMWTIDPDSDSSLHLTPLQPVAMKHFLPPAISQKPERKLLCEDIKPLLVQCDTQPQKESEAYASLTKFMDQCDEYKALNERSQEVTKLFPTGSPAATMISQMSASDMIRNAILPQLYAPDKLIEIPAGSQPSFFLPCRDLKKTGDYLKQSDLFLKHQLGMRGKSSYFDDEQRISAQLVNLSRLLMESFTKKVAHHPLSQISKANIQVTNADLSRHINFMTHVLIRALLIFQTGGKKSVHTECDFEGIINCVLMTARKIYDHMESPSLKGSHRYLLDTLFLECTRALVALLTRENMRFCSFITRCTWESKPTETLLTLGAIKHTLSCQTTIQDHLLMALDVIIRSKKAENYKIFVNLALIGSRSDLFKPLLPAIVKRFPQDRDLVKTRDILMSQTREFIRLTAILMRHMKVISNPENSPLPVEKRQQFLCYCRDIALPQFYCNVSKLSEDSRGREPTHILPPATVVKQVESRYNHLQIEKQHPEYQVNPQDFYIESLYLFSGYLTENLLSPKELKERFHQQIAALATEIGEISTPRPTVSGDKATSSAKPSVNAEPDSTDTDDEVLDYAVALPDQATITPTVTNDIDVYLKSIRNLSPKAASTALSKELEKSTYQRWERLALCAETAFQLVKSNQQPLAEISLAIPIVKNLYEKVTKSIGQLPQTLTRAGSDHEARKFLYEHFPDKALQKDMLAAVLEKVLPDQIKGVQESITTTYGLLTCFLREVQPMNNHENSYGGGNTSAERSALPLDYLRFVLDECKQTLAKVHKAREVIAAQLPVVELLDARLRLMRNLGFPRKKDQQSDRQLVTYEPSPLTKVSQLIKKADAKRFYNEHNEDPQKFCRDYSDKSLRKKFGQAEKQLSLRWAE